MDLVCPICKRRYKGVKWYNKHAKKFDMRHKIYQGTLWGWVDLQRKLDNLLGVKRV